MFFNRNQSGGVNWILVGLGNPGKQYESTRHNMGWLALDSLMEQEKFTLPSCASRRGRVFLRRTAIKYW